MAFSQVGSRTWVLSATLVTIATVVAVALRFGLSPQAPAFCVLAAAGVPLAFFDARTLPAAQRGDAAGLSGQPGAARQWRRRSWPGAPAGSATR